MGRVAVVLGAGGAVGHAYHAGILAALGQATGWDARRADVLVGTSAGAVVTAMLRAGVGAGDLYDRALGRPLSGPATALFGGMTWPRPGPADATGPRTWAPLGDPAQMLARAAWSGRRTSPGAVLAAALPAGRIPNEALSAAVSHLHRARGGRWPEAATWICAVRVQDGARVVFGRDAEADLGLAVAASCAIPAYYRPVEIDGALHVDGGVHSPNNADAVTGSGVDLVVVSSPMSGATQPRPTPGVERQMRALFTAGLRRELGALRRQGVPVVVFEPTADDQQAMGPDPMDTTRRAGTARQAFASALDHLQRADVAAHLGPLRAGG